MIARYAPQVTVCILVMWTVIGFAFVVGHARTANARQGRAIHECARTLELPSCRKAGLAP